MIRIRVAAEGFRLRLKPRTTKIHPKLVETVRIKQATKQGFIECVVGGLSISPIQTQKQGVVEYKRAERSARQLQHRIPASALLKKQIIPANPLDR